MGGHVSRVRQNAAAQRSYRATVEQVKKWAVERNSASASGLSRIAAPLRWLFAIVWLLILILIVTAALLVTGVEHGSELLSCKRALMRAERAHTRAIKSARAHLRAEQNAYEGRIQAASRELDYLRNPDGKKLARYRGVTLFERAIISSEGRSGIVGASAFVQASGGVAVYKRGTVTRVATGGLLLGPVGALAGGVLFKKKKNVDTREVYLTIGTRDRTQVIACPGSGQAGAQAFAAKVSTAAKQAAVLEGGRPAKIEQVSANLARLKSDSRALDAARADVARCESDPAHLESIARARYQFDAKRARQLTR